MTDDETGEAAALTEVNRDGLDSKGHPPQMPKFPPHEMACFLGGFAKPTTQGCGRRGASEPATSPCPPKELSHWL